MIATFRADLIPWALLGTAALIWNRQFTAVVFAMQRVLADTLHIRRLQRILHDSRRLRRARASFVLAALIWLVVVFLEMFGVITTTHPHHR
jgi:Na+/proline symporter